MTQVMVGKHAGRHGLADRHRADADAGVVAAPGDDLGLVAVAIDGLAWPEDRGGRLPGEARGVCLPGRDATENAAGVVRQEARAAVVAHAHLVGVLLAGHRGSGKAVADLDALHRVDAHQRGGKVGIELAVDRSAEARGNVLGDYLDHRANGRTLFAHAVEELLEYRHAACVGTEERVPLDLSPIPAPAVHLVCADLDQRAVHDHAGHNLSGDCAGRDPRSGFTRRLPAAAAIVAQPVLGVVNIVGVARAISVLDFRVVLRTLVHVLDQQRDRGAGRDLAPRFVWESSGQDLHHVRLAPLRGEARLPRPALVEVGLDVCGGQRNAWRAAIDYAAECDTVAL